MPFQGAWLLKAITRLDVCPHLVGCRDPWENNISAKPPLVPEAGFWWIQDFLTKEFSELSSEKKHSMATKASARCKTRSQSEIWHQKNYIIQCNSLSLLEKIKGFSGGVTLMNLPVKNSAVSWTVLRGSPELTAVTCILTVAGSTTPQLAGVGRVPEC